MTPETIQAIQSVAIDAIKILGPAIIAAVVAYKVAKVQCETSLKQTDKRMEFDARKAIHDLLIQRREKISEDIASAGETIGFVSGAAADDEDLSIYVELSNVTLRSAQRQCGATLSQYKTKQLTDTPTFSVLKECGRKAIAMKPASDFKSLRTNSVGLISIYEDLLYAMDVLIEQEVDEILAPYIQKKNS